VSQPNTDFKLKEGDFFSQVRLTLSEVLVNHHLEFCQEKIVTSGDGVVNGNLNDNNRSVFGYVSFGESKLFTSNWFPAQYINFMNQAFQPPVKSRPNICRIWLRYGITCEIEWDTFQDEVLAVLIPHFN
jgi:hypothetical protein